jgi:hypothetical protein
MAKVLWAGTLSWCRISCFFQQNSGHFLLLVFGALSEPPSITFEPQVPIQSWLYTDVKETDHHCRFAHSWWSWCLSMHHLLHFWIVWKINVKFHKTLHTDVLPNFHLKQISSKTTQHSYIRTRLIGNQHVKWIQSCLIQEASGSITFH